MPEAKILSLSSAHVTPETAEWLNVECLKNAEVFEYGEEHASSVHCAATAFGWLVHTRAADYDKFPGDLAVVLRYADEEGCAWVNIDRDEEEIALLPTYEWP